MPEQSTLEALSDPESDVYQCYARDMEEEGFGRFSTRDNAVAFAAAWLTYSAWGRACEVKRESEERRESVDARGEWRQNGGAWLVEVCW